MRKVVISLSLLLALSLGLFVTKNQWLVLGTKYALNKKFPNAVVYKQIKAQEGRIHVGQMHLHQPGADLTLEGMEFGLQFKEIFKHPKTLFSLYRRGVDNWMQLLVALREYEADLSIEQGVLQLEDYRYYFQLKKGKKRNEIATLSIGNDPASLAHPFLVIQFQLRHDQITAQLSVDPVATPKLFQLVAFAFPQLVEGFTEPNGTLQLHATMSFGPQGQVEEYAARFSCDDFEIHHPKSQLACQMHHLTGSVNYPAGINHEGFPFWKKLQCGLLIEEGNVVVNNSLALTHLQGTAVLDPQQDPEMDISGELVGEEIPLALHLGGKGSLHDDKAYWLEFILNLNDRQGTDCDATFSLCRPENETLVLQLEAENLLPGQVEMFKTYFAKLYPPLHNWKIQKGIFGGKLVAVLDKGILSQFEMQDLVAENVTIASEGKQHHFAKIIGDGSLKEMDFVLDLPAPSFLGLISDKWQELYLGYRPKDHARVSLSFRKEKAHTLTSAHVEFLETQQSFQFGYKCENFLPASLAEISEGWVRAEKLSHLLYGPFIRLIEEDLEIYGQMDLIAAFDGQRVQASIQMGEFLSKHPLVDIKAQMIGERSQAAHRAKFSYDLATGHFEGSVPLRGARVYERQYGLNFRDVDADLHIASEGFSASIKQSQLSFDGMKLLKDVKCNIDYKDKAVLTDLSAILPLDTDRSFSLQVPYLDQQKGEIQLFDEGQLLATFKGSKEKSWVGELKLSSFKDPFSLFFDWDPLRNLTVLKAEQPNWQLSCQKAGELITIENLTTGKGSLKAALTKQKEGFLLTHFELSRPDVILQGHGNLSVAMPQKAAPFEIKGELVADAHVLSPIELYAKAKHPLKFAFAPNLGLVLSNLDFFGEGCQCELGHLEWHHSTQKTFLNQCTFHLAQEPLQALMRAGALPAFLQEFQAFNTLNGHGGGYLDNQTLHFQGILKTGAEDLGFSVEWKSPSGKLTLTDPEKNESLQLQVHLDKGQFQLEALKGSLSGLSADLKKTKNQELKGNIGLDLASFSSLFNSETVAGFPRLDINGKLQLEGLFIPKEKLEDWRFKGKVKGQSLQWQSLSLGSMEAKMEIEPGIIGIEALDMADEAGKLWIGDGFLRRGSDGQWSFSFPLVEVRNLQPGALTAEKKITPFFIKTASLKNVRGRLGDLSSLVAEGSLRFVNLSKKGEKLIPKNFPFQALQRLGFDPGLLFPVGGEVHYVIQNERLVIKGVDSLFGEKRRFEWQAPRNTSMGFLDFEGNLAFDIQVKQFSGRSNSSPFAISVRGTWNDPQIAIK